MKYSKTFTMFLGLLCVVALTASHGLAGLVLGSAALFVLGSCLDGLVTPRSTLCDLVTPGSNAVDAELNLNELLGASIRAFKRAILPLRMFATVFRNVALKGTNKVAVPYYPLEGSASLDFAGTYVFGDSSNTLSREVAINKRKYQPLKLTGEEMARLPMLNAEMIGALKGEKLAYDVIQDILSSITAATYGAAIYTGAANTLDSDVITDIRTAVGKLNWPASGRGLLANLDVDGSLLKDKAFLQAYSIGTTDVIKEGRLPRVLGFDYAASNALPTNGEKLIGLAVFSSAILAAFSPIEPPADVRSLMTAYEIIDDADTGISLEYRQWGEPGTDTSKRVLECNYGFSFGETDAMKRIVSA